MSRTMSSIFTGRTILGVAVAATAAITASIAAPASGNAAAAPVRGDAAPNFTLTDTEGNTHTLADYTADGKIVVLEWFNPDCPFVKKFHSNETFVTDTYASFDSDQVVWLAINSGAEGKQGHGLERNKKARDQYNIDYPVLLDESGEIGRAFGAKRTPEMFVIDASGTIAYHGPIDDNKSGKKIGDTNYVKTAIQQVIDGETVVTPSIAPYGCSVKYGG